MEAEKLPKDVLNALARFRGNGGASSQSVAVLRKSFPGIPEDYFAFLQTFDGGEGVVGSNAYLMLWRASELFELNEAYEVAQYAPGLLLIGSDGGGEAFAFDLRQERPLIVQVPFVGMDLALSEQLGSSFCEFIRYLERL